MAKKGKDEVKPTPEEMQEAIINGFNQILAMEEVELEMLLKMKTNITAMAVNKQKILVMLGKIVGRNTDVINSLKIQ